MANNQEVKLPASEFTEQTVANITEAGTSDFVAGYTLSGGKANRKFSLSNIANYVLNKFKLSLGGSRQTVKSAIDTLNSKVAVSSKLFTKEATTTATIHLPSNGRFVIFETCNGANSLYAMLVTVYSSGAVYKLDLAKGNEVSAELSANTLTITSTPNVSFRILVMSLEPSISMDSITIS